MTDAEEERNAKNLEKKLDEFLDVITGASRNLDGFMREHAVKDLTMQEAFAMVMVNLVDIVEEAYGKPESAALISDLCLAVFKDRAPEFGAISAAFREGKDDTDK